MRFLYPFLLILLSLYGGEGARLQLQGPEGTIDVRPSRLVALFTKKGEVVSPHLKEGAFQAVFSGRLNLNERSRVYFKFSGFGHAVLKINGEVIVEASGEDLSQIVSKRLRLKKGEHDFRVEYKSQPSGASSLRLLWKGRDFPWEPVGPKYLAHESDAKLQESSLLRQGRELFAASNCIKCHADDSLKDSLAMPEVFRDAPSLENSGNRFSESWLAAWIQNPKALRPQATMPSLLKHASLDTASAAGSTDAIDLAAYLSTRKTADLPSKDLPPSYVKDGGDLFHKLGCVACHTVPGTEKQPERLSLNDVSWKFRNSTALASFLANPAKHYKWIKMPDFNLQDDEALKLASYLMSVQSPSKISPEKGDALKGKLLYEKLGCANCHESNMPGLQKLPLKALKGKKSGCLEAGPVDFRFSQGQKEVLTSFLAKGIASLGQRNLAEFAQRQIRELNCTACHKYDNRLSSLDKFHGESKKLQAHEESHLDQSRPILTWFGEKLKLTYLQKILDGSLDKRPRPWLDTRMPSFKQRAALLAAGMAASHGLGEEAKKQSKSDVNLEKLGKKAIGQQGFSCTICHDAGPKKTSGFEVKGIDLAQVYERLRPEYYLRWMANPQRVLPSTKMPNYGAALGDEETAEKKFLEIWEFLKQGRGMEAVK